ncbi:hypothetical protein STTU_4007 [Streptomyces sp. Tu6071]|nr:hypothetical protein STTU_4007 [Streptomyces sp. Tu6071]
MDLRDVPDAEDDLRRGEGEEAGRTPDLAGRGAARLPGEDGREHVEHRRRVHDACADAVQGLAVGGGEEEPGGDGLEEDRERLEGQREAQEALVGGGRGHRLRGHGVPLCGSVGKVSPVRRDGPAKCEAGDGTWTRRRARTRAGSPGNAVNSSTSPTACSAR